MESAPTSSGIPPSIDRVLRLFRSMGREEKMQALVQYSKKLEPLPDRFKDIVEPWLPLSCAANVCRSVSRIPSLCISFTVAST